MRRIASIFKRRSDKSDAGSTHGSEPPLPPSQPSKPSRNFFRTVSSKSLHKASLNASAKLSAVPPIPPMQTHSSSSSSTDSRTPRTPEDDSLLRSPQRRPSLPWLVVKKPVFHTERTPSWDAPPPFQTNKSHPTSAPTVDDSEDDESSTTSSSPSVSSLPRLAAPQAYAHSLTTNSLMPAFSAPPLLHLPGIPLFPRSCNPISSLSHKESTGSILLRTRLLHRLEHHPNLSPSEVQSITPFASRRIPPKCSPSLVLDDNAIKDTKRIGMTSLGLKTWISRPCFEDRMVVYTPAAPESVSGFNVGRVTGSMLGVEALEASPGLEALAGLTVEDASEMLTPSSATSSSSSLAVAPASNVQTRNQQYKPNPSPLRLETTPPSPMTMKSSSKPPSPALTTSPNRRVKNSVRFEVEDKEVREDTLPLGQIMRIKQGRAEKAKFLELERERRVLEEERRRHGIERRKWEKEKQAWDDERRAIEEERKQRQYSQEFVAARKRREAQYKFGSSSNLDDSQDLAPSATTHSRPYNGSYQRQNSERSASYLERDNSQESFRGNSRTRADSRPTSTYSHNSTRTLSSAEDVRSRDSRGRSSHPGYFIPDPSRNLLYTQPTMPYGWAVVPPVPALPIMPYYSFNTDNMPLLPPTPPFMMHEHRRRSFNSSSPSSSPETSPASRNADKSPRREHIQRKNPHQRHSSGEIVSSKRLSVASLTSSSPASPSYNDRTFQSRSAPSQPPVRQAHSYSSSSSRMGRRQTAIT